MQPVHFLSRMKHICGPQAACGPSTYQPCCPQFSHLHLSGPLCPPWVLAQPLHLQITRTGGLLSLCPLFSLLLARLALQLSLRGPPKGSPCSWPRCRYSGVAPRPPPGSWHFSTLPASMTALLMALRPHILQIPQRLCPCPSFFLYFSPLSILSTLPC